MHSGKTQRVSGTYFERLLFIAVPVPLLALVLILFKKGSDFAEFPWEITVILFVIILLIWIVDAEHLTRLKPVPLFVNAILEIGSDLVRPEDVLSLTPLRRYRQIMTSLFEIRYAIGIEEQSALIMSKPDFAIIGLFRSPSRSIRMLLKQFPSMSDRLLQEKRI